MTIIDTSLITEKDRVYIYDGGEDMLEGDDWSKVTDFVNDTWVFDMAANGTAQLIIQFAREREQTVAHFYDDRDGDRRVSYEYLDDGLHVHEAGSWTLKIRSNDDWFLSNGFPNQNLRFFWDGHLDQWSEVVDSDHDGVPDYEVWGIIDSEKKAMDRTQQSGMWVNEGNKRPALLDKYLFWPFLLIGDWPDIRNKFDSVPFVYFDWLNARVEGISVGKDDAGYPIESGYFIAGRSEWKKHQENHVNNENPMAYYDLAQDQDGWPEMHIRFEYYDAMDPYVDIGLANFPINGIRYSWNQNNSPNVHWEYKLGLAGRNTVTSTVWFDDFGVRTVSYDQLPYWIHEQEWAWGTFVANEDQTLNTPSSEGLYDWPATNTVRIHRNQPETTIKDSQLTLRRYLVGKGLVPPETLYTEIRPGFRGEFGYLDGRVGLYFSLIDARLHLKEAMQGIWNVDDTVKLSYADGDGDGYFDQWLFRESDEVVKELYTLKEHLVYSNDKKKTVLLKQVNIQLASFELPPPRNYDDWLTLDRELKKHARGFLPDDFEAMVAQFEGPTLSGEGATLRDFRLTATGYRFVLDLRPGFRLNADMAFEDLKSALPAPGSYVVSYSGQEFDVSPLTKAQPFVQDFVVTNESGTPAEVHRWHTIEAHIGNKGSEDVQNLTICTVIERPSGLSEIITSTVALLPGGGQHQLMQAWAPAEAGSWQFQISAGCGSETDLPGFGQLLHTGAVEVLPQGLPPGRWFLTLGGRVSWVVGLLLTGITFLAGTITVIWSRDWTAISSNCPGPGSIKRTGNDR